MRLFLLLFVIALGTSAFAQPNAPFAPAKPLAPAPARRIEIAAYEAGLKKLERALGAASPHKKDIQRAFPPSGTVRRADGQSQRVSNAQWFRALGAARKDGRFSRRDARQFQAAVAAQQKAFQLWRTSDYTAADAKTILSQLTSSGQIRVGPTALQLWLTSVRQWFGDLMKRIAGWFSFTPPAAPNIKTPQIDPKWITFFFYSCVFSLLAVVIYFVWKALGGRIGRRVARHEERVLEGEDAELLKLPSDELFARADNFASRNDFREAVRHRFIATLVRFDERALWRYDTRRTNREHIALLRSDAARSSLAAPLETLARRFDRVRYGNSAVSSDDWARFAGDADAVENADNARADAVRPSNKTAGGARA